MKTCAATASMMCRIRSRSSLLAVMSRKVSSSAPCLVVAARDLDRIPGVLQLDEVDALDHAAG
jgi:hypothetical protein